MQKPSEQRVPELQNIASREGVRGMVTALHKFLVGFVRSDTDFKSRVVAELNPLYGELDWTPVEILNGAQGPLITIDVPDAVLGNTAEVSYDQDLQGLLMSTPYVVDGAVKVVLRNGTGGPMTLDPGRFRAYVWSRVLTS